MRRKLSIALGVFLYVHAIYLILQARPDTSKWGHRKVLVVSVVLPNATFSNDAAISGVVPPLVDNEQPVESEKNTATRPTDVVPDKKRKGRFLRYNVCNGFSNQLLIHAAYIARAKENGQIVQIPDYFITDGVQTTNENVTPNGNNSISFAQAFDRPYFEQKMKQLGVEARFRTFDNYKAIPRCNGITIVQHADPILVKQILEAFRPSPHIDGVIRQIQQEMNRLGMKAGICVHHRDGQDWHDHCQRWESIEDGVYRGNCLGPSSQTFTESLQDRGLDKSKWIYYCGDHDAPSDLRKAGYKVLSRSDMVSNEESDIALARVQSTEARDLWALIDFFSCTRLPTFIGNSVSSFSALQIALKNGEGAYWYNSQSIPLSEMWRIYDIPLVYTYTETSATAGQHLLKASIASVKRHMPRAKILILYHGEADKTFRTWLLGQNVIIHNHDPKWKDKIEEMRKHGDPSTSHLFLHPGNYLGTWQRIDIPLFLNYEYCLLLDSDTIIQRPFTLADFGLEMPYGLAMSSEIHMSERRPSNAGVTLMNVPRLRRTYKDFLDFIVSHVETGFNHPCPSDQGAYLVFYQNVTNFLDRSFNVKPYWPMQETEFQQSHIIHFHGPKPAEYLKFILGQKCNKASGDLCLLATKRKVLCPALREFAVAIQSIDGGTLQYCEVSFSNSTEVSICRSFLEGIANDTILCNPQELLRAENPQVA